MDDPETAEATSYEQVGIDDQSLSDTNHDTTTADGTTNYDNTTGTGTTMRTSSAETVSTREKSGQTRHYASVLLDLQKQRKKAKKDAASAAAKMEAGMKIIEHAIEDMNVHLPEEGPCDFDAEDTGIGRHMRRLAAHMDDIENKQKAEKEEAEYKRHMAYMDARALSLAQARDNATRGSAFSTHVSFDVKFRFKKPEHIRQRQKQEEVIDWFNERIEESTIPVRFELPSDYMDLSGMDVKTYLKKYCRIPKPRMIVYKRFYKKHKAPKSNSMISNEMSGALRDILYQSVSEEEVSIFLAKMGMSELNKDIDINLFAVIAATAERICYLSYAETEGPLHAGVARPFVECADFENLRWKLQNVKLRNNLRLLLASLG